MPDPKIIVKEGLAPARKPILKRLKQVMDARIKIQSGPGADEVDTDANGVIIHIPPSLCIMEATSYILGWDQEPGHEVNDGPPCTSEIISSLMIELNDDDGTTDRQRAQMKKVIPDIINTAPLVWAIDKSKGCLKGPDGKCLRDEQGLPKYPEMLDRNIKDSDYKYAEFKREDMIDVFQQSHKLGDRYKSHIPMKHWLALIRELAAVAKFDAANRETEADWSTPAVDLTDNNDDKDDHDDN